MRKYYLYVTAAMAAVMLGVSGCATQTNASTDTVAASGETEKETTVSDTVVESVTGPIESMEESQPEISESIRVFGPVVSVEEGRITMDNQSGLSSSGEMVLNISEDATYILDAVTGDPSGMENIKEGDIIYAYIGPAMTMSLPPMTNAQMILTNIPADFKVPDYVTVKSVITDASSSHSVLTAVDGTEFTLAEDCNIFPYLTRNIVTLDDLTEGRKCMVWSGDDNTAVKIMVFAQ